MNIRSMLAATQKGLGQLVGPASKRDDESGIRRLLSGTQKGLGVSPKPAVETAPKIEVKAVGAPQQSAPQQSAPQQRAKSPVSLPDSIRSTRRGLESVKVVMATGLYKTAAGMVGQRVLKENDEALRAYLAVGLRDVGAAVKAMTGIEQSLEQGGSEEMAKGPTKRSGVFLAARNTVEYERLFGDAADRPSSAVPWEPTPPGRIDGWGRALDEIRYGLAEHELELLMLHHHAKLELTELAYVLDTPRDEIQKKLDAAKGYVRFLLEDVFGETLPKLEELLDDAFLVEPPTPEQITHAKPKAVPLPEGTLLGERYEVEGVLGGGEFAYVYRARDVRVPGHVVALKLLHRRALTPAAREGAMRELSLIASAFHPSIVQFKDHGWFEDRLWFVMPFYEGEMLLDRIDRGPVPLDEALTHFERLARGLAALHTAGIRHQDVKPENIYLVELRTGADEEKPELLPVLLDLGVAAPSGEMALAGTPMYFPPEVAGRLFDESETPVTAKADVFALALSLLHSIEEPDLSELDGVEVEEFMRRRAKHPPTGPSDRRHAFLQEHFARWLSPEPQERPSAGQLADELAALRESRSPRSRTWTPPKRFVQLLVAATMAALVLGATLLVDAPPRPVQVVEGEAAASTLVAGSEAERLLERRLETERRRSEELEEELGRLRRQELGLERPDAPANDR